MVQSMSPLADRSIHGSGMKSGPDIPSSLPDICFACLRRRAASVIKLADSIYVLSISRRDATHQQYPEFLVVSKPSGTSGQNSRQIPRGCGCFQATMRSGKSCGPRTSRSRIGKMYKPIKGLVISLLHCSYLSIPTSQVVPFLPAL